MESGLGRTNEDKRDAAFFNVWSEWLAINEWQTQTVTKYILHKWCVFKVTSYKSNLDWPNK